MDQAVSDVLSSFDIETLLVRGARVLALLLAAPILSKLASRVLQAAGRRLTGPVPSGADAARTDERNKRVLTLTTLAAKALSIVIWAIALVMALREAGFDIVPLLAGAGVVGLAIGFGAQNLVRDIISGAFLLLEDQISVGDVAVINGTGGSVQEINLRTTVLRDFEGTVHVFPNGGITALSNRTQGFSSYAFDVGVSYDEDPDRVIATLNQMGAELQDEPQWSALVSDPLEVLGVDRFTDAAVVIRMRIKTLPGRQWEVGREINRRIKVVFDAEGIRFGFPGRSVRLSGAGGAEDDGGGRGPRP